MNEIWKPVPIEGYEHLYAVSNLGRVMSYDKISYQYKKGYYFTPSRIMKSQSTYQGYKRLTLLCRKGQKMANVHRLVALAFIPNPYDKPFVNHIDGDKANNSITNLEWVTQKENIHHAYTTGLVPRKLKKQNEYETKSYW